jgi:hypothetical protein
MMSFFRKKDKDKSSDTNLTPLPGAHRKDMKRNANKKQRSKVDEKILRDGPDTGFVWNEEA